jgi:ligand-binding SRPBCC domain-containing protein
MARIHLETEIAAPIETVFDLARDLDFHMRSMAHTTARAVGGRTSGRIELGETVTWQARHLGRTWSLTSEIVELEAPTRFVDRQTAGPFAWFRHVHRFEAIPGGTRMIDDWEHASPFGLVGRIADRLVLVPLLTRLLERRNAELAREAASGVSRTGSV